MITSGFFTSRNGDRKYTAEQIGEYFKGLIGNGVFADVSNALQVQQISGAMQVNVLAGRAFIDCFWLDNDSAYMVPITQSEIALDRIDSIVVQLDKTLRKMSIQYLEGTPAATPAAPSLTREDLVKEYRLANIYVAAGATSISQSNITDTRASSDCGWVTCLIDQVDTSTLFTQWQTAYEESYAKFNEIYLESGNKFDQFLAEQENAFNEWFATLTGDLTIGTNLVTYESGYTSTEETTTIPIQIPQYDATKDILQAYINGVYLVKNVDYTLNEAGTSIVLTTSITADQYVNFIVTKNIVGTGGTELADEVAALGNQVNSMQSKEQYVTVTLPSTATTLTYTLPTGFTAKNTTVLDIMTTDLGVSLIRSSSLESEAAGRLTLKDTTYINQEVDIILKRYK